MPAFTLSVKARIENPALVLRRLSTHQLDVGPPLQLAELDRRTHTSEHVRPPLPAETRADRERGCHCSQPLSSPIDASMASCRVRSSPFGARLAEIGRAHV